MNKIDKLIKQLDSSTKIVICNNYKNCKTCSGKYTFHNAIHIKKHDCYNWYCESAKKIVECIEYKQPK